MSGGPSVAVVSQDGWALLTCSLCGAHTAVEIPEQDDQTYRMQHCCGWSPPWMRLAPDPEQAR